jgi:predicted transposase YbfD/YdcC
MLNDLGLMKTCKNWVGLNSVIVIESISNIKNQVGVNVEWRFFLSSLHCDARYAAELVRAHWGIENSLHWVLDVAFREDECRKRQGNSAENFSILRRIALNLLKQEKTQKLGFKGKRLRAAWDTNYLHQVLFK